MRLHSVNITGFRSIETATLASCGAFNILIGKNNSGKSNALSAISAFFACLSDSSIVTLDPPVGRALDFFDRDVSRPIRLTIAFDLDAQERDDVIRDIATEAPQMRHALDDIDPALRLSVTISIAPPSGSFGYVSQIDLANREDDGPPQPARDRTLFSVDHGAAAELYEKLSQARKYADEADAITTLLPEARRYATQMFGPKDSESRPPLRYLLDVLPSRVGVRTSPDLLRELEVLVEQASSFDEFASAAQNAAARRREDAKRLRDEPLKNKILTFTGDQSAIPGYVTALLARIAACRVLYLRERRTPIGREEAARLLNFKITRGGPQVLRGIQETVSSLLGVQIDAFESEASSRPNHLGRRAEPNAELDVDNFLADVNGSGIREALRIILDVEFEHPSILLIEEPEIYLHPSLETSMMRYLKRVSATCQVFIATHSTNFLDNGEMKNIYLCAKDNATQISLLDYEEAASQVPRELGLRLSALFMFDRLVFVEGPSDEAALREWASTLQVNFGHRNVGFIHMGGARNFTHYAAEATLSLLAGRRVQLSFLLDRDERDDADIARLQRLARPNATVDVLQRRELENYLLVPRAIAELLAEKSTAAGSPDLRLGEAEIATALEECAEQLKCLAIEKRVVRELCPPIYADTKALFDHHAEGNIAERVRAEVEKTVLRLEEAKGTAENVFAEKTALIEKEWASSKLSLVPGDTLLDLVCQRYGCRFAKQKDTARLARLMREGEIPAEIQAIVRQIGASGSTA